MAGDRAHGVPQRQSARQAAGVLAVASASLWEAGSSVRPPLPWPVQTGTGLTQRRTAGGELRQPTGSQSPTVRRDNLDVSVLRLIFDRPGWRIEQLRDVLNGGI